MRSWMMSSIARWKACYVRLESKSASCPREGTETPEGRRLRDVVSRCGALATERQARDFDVQDLENDLGRLVRGKVEAHRAVIDQPHAAACLAAVLRFSEMLADSANHGRCTLSMYDTGRYMRLDASALRALNVLPERSDGPSSFSLYGLLNKCRTPMGRRLLSRWLKQPLVDVNEIATRHDVVNEFVTNAEVRDALRGAHLRALPDIERITRKLERRKASLMDLCRLYQASAALPHMAEALERCEGRHGDYIRKKYAEELKKLSDPSHLGRFEALLEAAVDLSKIPDEYVICASYDAELGELQKQKDTLEKQIRDAFADASDDLGMERDKQLKLEHNNMHGWFMRLTKKGRNERAKKAQRELSDSRSEEGWHEVYKQEDSWSFGAACISRQKLRRETATLGRSRRRRRGDVFRNLSERFGDDGGNRRPRVFR